VSRRSVAAAVGLLLSAVRAGGRYRQRRAPGSGSAAARPALSSEYGQCHVDGGRRMLNTADVVDWSLLAL